MTTPLRHLIHVGYPKAGATFFKRWCESRSDVAYRPRGFAGFDSPHDIASERGPRAVLRVTRSESLLSFSGPPSSYREAGARRSSIAHYADGAALARQQERSLETLAALFPTAHTLILVRGYDTICRSMVSQGIKVGREWSGQDGEAFLAMLADMLDYDRVVGLYEQAFGADHVTVLPYELLRAAPQAFVRALCEVGGVEYQTFDPGRVNASPPPYALGLVARISGVVQAGLAPLRPSVKRPLMDGYRAALTRVHARPGLDHLGKALGVTPFPERLFTADELRAAFAGRATAVAQRPEVAPYAAHYVFGL